MTTSTSSCKHDTHNTQCQLIRFLSPFSSSLTRQELQTSQYFKVFKHAFLFVFGKCFYRSKLGRRIQAPVTNQTAVLTWKWHCGRYMTGIVKRKNSDHCKRFDGAFSTDVVFKICIHKINSLVTHTLSHTRTHTHTHTHVRAHTHREIQIWVSPFGRSRSFLI